MTDALPTLPAPLGILAELTHRCPLACPYCSNPMELEGRKTELDTATWARVFQEAAAMGVLQAHLSGGEPASRRDIVEITAAARDAGLYTNMITSGVGVPSALLERLRDAGLDHVQVSIQDVEPDSADRIAGYRGAFARKRELARHVVALGLPLTVNVVVHRANIARIAEMVESAIALDAGRVEIAHVQYYGWALKNRAALMPTRDQVRTAMVALERVRAEHQGRIMIDAVVPDYYARRPKPCMGGWGMRSLNVTPSGKVLPCHAAETIPGLEFWNVQDRALADIWRFSPGFQKFRGDSWMPELCRSCEFKERDFGGCRCQALAIAGDAAATDPACDRSPFHARMLALAEADATAGEVSYAYRGRDYVHAEPAEPAEAMPIPIPVP